MARCSGRPIIVSLAVGLSRSLSLLLSICLPASVNSVAHVGSVNAGGVAVKGELLGMLFILFSWLPILSLHGHLSRSSKPR